MFSASLSVFDRFQFFSRSRHLAKHVMSVGITLLFSFLSGTEEGFVQTGRIFSGISLAAVSGRIPLIHLFSFSGCCWEASDANFLSQRDLQTNRWLVWPSFPSNSSRCPCWNQEFQLLCFPPATFFAFLVESCAEFCVTVSPVVEGENFDILSLESGP